MKRVDKIIISITVIIGIIAIIITAKIIIFDKIVIPVDLKIYVNDNSINIANRIEYKWDYYRKNNNIYDTPDNYSDFNASKLWSNNIKIKKEDKVEVSFDNMSIFILGRNRDILINIYDETGYIVKEQKIKSNRNCKSYKRAYGSRRLYYARRS